MEQIVITPYLETVIPMWMTTEGSNIHTGEYFAVEVVWIVRVDTHIKQNVILNTLLLTSKYIILDTLTFVIFQNGGLKFEPFF